MNYDLFIHREPPGNPLAIFWTGSFAGIGFRKSAIFGKGFQLGKSFIFAYRNYNPKATDDCDFSRFRCKFDHDIGFVFVWGSDFGPGVWLGKSFYHL